MSEQKEVKKRPLSTSEDEIQLLKNAFAGNEELLKAVRSLFLGFKVSPNEAILIKSTFSDPKLVKALRKRMYPVIESEVAIGESSDYWFGTEGEIIGKDPSTVRQIVEHKKLNLDMLVQAFGLLKDPSGKKIDIAYEPDFEKDPYQIGLLARLKYIRTVETGLMILKVIAGQKAESVQAAKERLEKDSSR